jgi:putative transposase
MKRDPYPTDLTDAQWDLLAPLLPPAPWWGRPRAVDMREVLNAILYVARTGIQWRALPHDFPKWRTVYYYVRTYIDGAVWEAINDALRTEVRAVAGKHEEPSAVIIDSQSVKVTAIPGERGYDAGKQVNGRKRSVIVETLGLLMRVVVHAADVSDLQGGKLVAELVAGMKQRIEKVWGDQHYGGEFADWVQATYNWVVEVKSRPPNVAGFVVIPKRWLVERTFGWLTWFRRLSKDYEQLVEVSEAFIYVAMIHLMLRRLRPADTS